jgi:hypothetical protein
MVKLAGRRLLELAMPVNREIEGTDRRVATVYQLATASGNSPGQETPNKEIS